MSRLIETLRLISDPTRLRILHLLGEEELTVAELQAVLGMKQSRISSQLAQLKKTALVDVRRSGQNNVYCMANVPELKELGSLLQTCVAEIEEADDDRAALRLLLRKRDDRVRAYFDELAGKFGRTYCPGRSWKGLADMLLKLMPPLVIADLGAGEGGFSQLLAQRAKKVIAIDNAPKMVEFGANLAREHGLDNLEYRLGDIMDPPIEDVSVDLAFFSQALHHAIKPQAAIDSAARILKPGGRIVVLDLLKHQFEEARELYADVWLGFSEVELDNYLNNAGFNTPEISIVHREEKSPRFQTLLAIADKPEQ